MDLYHTAVAALSGFNHSLSLLLRSFFWPYGAAVFFGVLALAELALVAYLLRFFRTPSAYVLAAVLVTGACAAFYLQPVAHAYANQLMAGILAGTAVLMVLHYHWRRDQFADRKRELTDWQKLRAGIAAQGTIGHHTGASSPDDPRPLRRAA